MPLLESSEDFSKIAVELSPLLLRYLSHMVGDLTAKDLLQETLIRMAKGLAKFEQRSSFKTWSYAIASRVAADYFRSPENNLDVVDIDDVDSADVDSADVDRPIDEHMIVTEMSTCVRHVIGTLPVDYRMPLILHDLEGMSTEQVAVVCSCTLATAKIRIHRARSRLKKILEQNCVLENDDDGVLRCDKKTLHLSIGKKFYFWGG